MQKKFGIDAFIASAQEHIEAKLRSSWTCLQRTDSPIEDLFFAGMIMAWQFNDGAVTGLLTPPKERDLEGIDVAPDHIILKRQVRVIDWPVDFLLEITGQPNGTPRLVVECDGHEFHERTKEQAARDRSRDRALQEMGITVFRFTGSELYRDPWRCVMQAMTWADKVIMDNL